MSGSAVVMYGCRLSEVIMLQELTEGKEQQNEQTKLSYNEYITSSKFILGYNTAHKVNFDTLAAGITYLQDVFTENKVAAKIAMSSAVTDDLSQLQNTIIGYVAARCALDWPKPRLLGVDDYCLQKVKTQLLAYGMPEDKFTAWLLVCPD